MKIKEMFSMLNDDAKLAFGIQGTEEKIEVVADLIVSGGGELGRGMRWLLPLFECEISKITVGSDDYWNPMFYVYVEDSEFKHMMGDVTQLLNFCNATILKRSKCESEIKRFREENK